MPLSSRAQWLSGDIVMNPKYGVFLLAILLLASNRLSNGGDAEWGHLSGRFLYDCDPPPAKSLPVPAFKLQNI